MTPHVIVVFPSRLGWMAIIAAGSTVRRLSFGHRTSAAAKAAVSKGWHNGHPLARRENKQTAFLRAIVARLRAYAAGAADQFHDIRIDPGPLSEFQRQVLEQCRRVPYGSTVIYAELAVGAGYPGAARAVGNCMAANGIPLLVPCHRVVCSDGRLGAYSACGGSKMKRRLLALESQN